MSFMIYLQQQKCSSATIKTYEKYLGYITRWLGQEYLDAELIHYSDLLDYMKYVQDKGKSNRSIAMQLNVVRHYLNYLMSENKRTDNPAAGHTHRPRHHRPAMRFPNSTCYRC